MKKKEIDLYFFFVATFWTGTFEELNIKTPKGFVKLGEIAQVDVKNQNTYTIDLINNPDYVKPIHDAIAKANLNCNPQIDKTTINLPIPKVTREHRENLVKAIKAKYDSTMKRMRETEGKALRKAKENKKVSKDLSFNTGEYVSSSLSFYHII